MKQKTQRLIGDVGSTQKYAKVFILNNFLSALIFTHLYLIRAIHLFRFFNCSHHFSNCVISSKGLKTFCRSLLVTCKYRRVVFISLCPGSFCISTTSVPLSNKCVAKLWRSMCMLRYEQRLKMRLLNRMYKLF